MTEMKRCVGTTKAGDKSVRLSEPHMTPRENFHKKSSSKDGLRSQCKVCEKIYTESSKLLPKVPPPEFMTCRECGQTKHHSVMRNNSVIRTGKENLCFECDSSRSLQWTKDNPERVRAKNQRRYDLLRSLPNENVSKEVLLEIHGPNCYLCGLPVPEEIGQWDMDHVIPSSRGDIGTTYANCRVAHAKCNRSKNAKTYFEYETQRSTHYVTVPNLYLFNDNAKWHYQQIFKEALERGKQ